jgi:methylated-DNA-[protein]-cysteine S-methyltransferase
MTRLFSEMPSPIGVLTIASNGTHIVALHMGSVESLRARMPKAAEWTRADAALADARDQLTAYFDGRLREFTLPLAPEGTPFQQRVWQALRGIAYGATASYGDIAASIGAPGSARAVGAANGQNPLAIVVPCHRVIGADGSLTGYGGGMARKQYLLELEARTSGRQLSLV